MSCFVVTGVFFFISSSFVCVVMHHCRKLKNYCKTQYFWRFSYCYIHVKSGHPLAWLISCLLAFLVSFLSHVWGPYRARFPYLLFTKRQFVQSENMFAISLQICHHFLQSSATFGGHSGPPLGASMGVHSRKKCLFSSTWMPVWSQSWEKVLFETFRPHVEDSLHSFRYTFVASACVVRPLFMRLVCSVDSLTV